MAAVTEVITLDKSGRYDLGSRKAIVQEVRAFGLTTGDRIGDYFPPLEAPNAHLPLTGKFKVDATIREARKSYYQLTASGEDTLCSTYIKIDASRQKIFDQLVTLQIVIKIIEV